tara:strand:+ start:330 stop:698 length:369 start_codon:yes stop_codon:yes gene_type:complete
MNKKLINAVARQIGSPTSLRESASDICNYGASGGFNGFIYYTDTVAFTTRHHTLIMELLNNYADDMGVNALELLNGFNCFKDMKEHEIFDGLMNSKSDDRTTIYNGLAWFALEEAARYIEEN